MKHVAQVIEELRRYIAASAERADLEEVDTLLSVALADLKRKLARKRTTSPNERLGSDKPGPSE